ncbi:hypothetical protein ROLI_032610 [Roseobacter fucihabitans]|uniref:Lipoprotein n=1 Tax=Roseobacter fucihabitans TaxID=1537242 RepID=A0ABZ2BVV5_9RHOB|nr:hypothetical protein [Roseobacter litoralis]MBC6965067.1 hypothetical protein [Roseobacter litoralis]
MIQKMAFISATALLALGACATVSSETISTVVVDGEAYDVRTRTIEGANGSYETSSVRVNARYYLCILDSPGDCEAAARRGLEDPIDRF